MWHQYGMNTVQIVITSCLASCAVPTRRDLAARLRLIKQSCPTIVRFHKMSMYHTHRYLHTPPINVVGFRDYPMIVRR